MADHSPLVAVALPADCVPESLPLSVARLISLSWPGVGHAQLMEVPAGSTCVHRCGRSSDGGEPRIWPALALDVV